LRRNGGKGGGRREGGRKGEVGKRIDGEFKGGRGGKGGVQRWKMEKRKEYRV